MRPQLEYGSKVIYENDAIQIENVQRCAIKPVKSISQLGYTERLEYLRLPSLQYKRLNADIVETCKTINDVD